MQLAASGSAKGGDSLSKLYKRLASDPKGAAAARQLLDSAASTKEGKGPSDQLRQVIETRTQQAGSDDDGPAQTRPQLQQNQAGGQLTQSQQNQQAHEQAEEAEGEQEG